MIEHIIELGKVINIEKVEEFFKSNMLPDGVECLRINAADIEQIDTAGLQLVLFYVLSCKNANCKVKWDPAPSDQLIEKARRAGFVEKFDIISGDMT